MQVFLWQRKCEDHTVVTSAQFIAIIIERRLISNGWMQGLQQMPSIQVF
jgi:hypothetical protein